MPFALIGSALTSFGLKLIGAAFGEKAIAAIFFYAFEKLVASTENPLDNKIYTEVKSAYYGEPLEVESK